MENTKIRELNVEGVNYTVKAMKKKKKQISPEKEFNQKLNVNLQEQERELNALKLLYKEKFKVKAANKYSIEIFLRGGHDASLQFSYPPEYPSAIPPTYTLTAPWVREQKRMELFKDLANIFTENFGECIMYKWVDKIMEVLKKEVEEKKKNPQEFEEPQPVIRTTQEPPKEENVPEIYEGKPIADRGSCFSPYLARVTSEEEVRKIIARIEGCRKVSGAWRNTYAYRISSGNKMTEVGEDGGEPKAGGNLLRKLITYNAENVLVYISRRFGGRMLGPDRYKHLNDTADTVLEECGFKSKPQGKKSEKEKEIEDQKKNFKKFGKKKK